MTINLTNAEDALFHTIQGEGKYIGYPATFIRLSRCNLRCQWKNKDGSFTTCDTPHTSFNPIIEKHEIEDIVNDVEEGGNDHVVITGGEPFFQKSVVQLIDVLVSRGYFVTVETNGTLYHDNKAQFLSISPKLSSSSMSPEHGDRHEKNRINIDTLTKMISNGRHEYQFKFVVNDELDVVEIETLVEEIFSKTGEYISENIWLMPQGVSDAQFKEKLHWLAEVCKDRNWKLTDRLHIRIWGARKGV